MNTTYFKKQISDKLSICLSICCILHCIALPVVILMLPSVASLWITNEKVHVILVLIAIPISLFAMIKSLRVHNNYKCISLAVVGLFLLVTAIFMHDIDFNNEQTHIEQEQTLHAETGHDEHGEKEHTEHEHHEHGGIGETLETIFTVLGGLVLLSAHYLNIRFTNKTI